MTKRPLKLWLLRKIKYFLTGWERKLTPVSPAKNPNHLVDLTPKTDLEKSKSYRETLKWALENTDVYNIALTGPYGSGKSSILKAFEQVNPQYQYLKISLASFSEDLEQNDSTSGYDFGESTTDTEKPKDAKDEEVVENKKFQPEKKSERVKERAKQELHRQIELSILQQIFYRVTDEHLPQSRFKRIKKLSWNNLWRFPLFGIIWAISAYFVFNKDFRVDFYQWKSMSFSIETWIFFICLLCTISGSFWLLYQITKLLVNAKFSKFNILGGGLELNYTLDKSILNKHLDEILYFFEETDFDVVIIEDLDRFNDPDIFTKLRELNLLINNADQVPQKVKFIYAIKDDIFTDGNRTKFFDFIIPVLPVINYSNALDQFLPKLEAVGITEKELPKKFLYDITLYINDMRILNNIFNEFMLYKENLKHVKKLDHLLGMIVYKNIEPKDFSELHCHRGIINEVMSNKGDFIEHISKTIQEDITKKNEFLKKINQELSLNIKTLRAAYIQQFIEMISFEPIAIMTSSRTALKDMVSNEHFDHFKSQTQITYYHPRPSVATPERSENSNLSFHEIEKKVGEFGYDERAAFIEAKNTDEANNIQKEIAALRNQLSILRTKNYKYLLTAYKDEIIFFGEAFTKNELLVYLVRNGYIDEMYERYMSYFYDKSLKSTDFDFLKHIRNLEPQPFGYALTNTEEILHRLEAGDFIAEELLNFDLLDYLFKNEYKFKAHLKTLFGQLANESRRSLDFTFEYLSRPKYAERYAVMLADYWPDMWKNFVSSGRYTPDQLKPVLKYIVTRCDIKTLEALDGEHHKLKWSIADSDDILTYINEPEFEDKFKQVITDFRINFTALKEDQVDAPLFDFIYENWHFRLNPEMVALMANTKGTMPIAETDLQNANYTHILKSGAIHLTDYISDYLDTYIEYVILALPDNTKESEATILLVLKNLNVLFNNHESFIKKQDCKISDINLVDQPFWDLLLVNNKMAPNWKNIITYYAINNLNKELIAYLNELENYKLLSSDRLNSSDSSTELNFKDLALSIINSKEITVESFTALLNAVPFKYDQQSIYEPIESEKIEIMIKKGNIPLTIFNFNELKVYQPNAHISLIARNVVTYFRRYSDYNLDIKDNMLLLNSNLSDKSKQKIAELINEEQLQANKTLAENIANRMIKGGYVQRPFSKIMALAQHGSNNTNLSLTAMHISDFNAEQAKALVIALGGNYAKITNKNKNPDFPDSPVNEQILTILKNKRVIVDYQVYKGKLKVYHTERKIK